CNPAYSKSIHTWLRFGEIMRGSLSAMLRFRRSGSKLTLINPTPYFITVTNMKAGNSNLPNTMVPPKGEVSVDITHAATGDISFQTINDYGALTPRIKATMQ
ncbi:hypothetical protein SNA82_24070, partial [Escherichia coli]|nr:hypothetical protein [Escherichia coli]